MTIQFTAHTSWETGISHMILKSRVEDKKVFAALCKAGLFYHKYDEEGEERFNTWAVAQINYFNMAITLADLGITTNQVLLNSPAKALERLVTFHLRGFARDISQKEFTDLIDGKVISGFSLQGDKVFYLEKEAHIEMRQNPQGWTLPYLNNEPISVNHELFHKVVFFYYYQKVISDGNIAKYLPGFSVNDYLLERMQTLQ